MPAVREHLTPKFYVDRTTFYFLDEVSLLRLDPNDELEVDKQNSITPNSTLTSPKTILELPTKKFVESFHQTNRNRRDLSSVFNDQDNEYAKNILTILDGVTVNKEPISDNELLTENNIGGSIGEGTML